MRILTIILAFLNGAYMLFDGAFVMLNGKYFGPAKPGPWSALFEKLGVDVFKLGPLFMAWGLAWLTLAFLMGQKHKIAKTLGLGIAVLTLWYLPVGTLISVVVIISLLSRKAGV